MKKNLIEVLIGTFVLTMAIAFTIFAYKKADFKSHLKSYNLIAKFDHIDGINPGSDVKIAGVKVGDVKSYQLDPKTFRAIIEFDIESKIKIPIDSSIQIASESLLGGKYLMLSPGAEDETLNPNDEVKYTQSSVNIESLIGKMMFNGEKK